MRKIPAVIKLIWLAMFGVLALVLSDVRGFMILGLVLAVSILAMGVNLKKLIRVFLPALPFIIVISLAQALLTGGGSVMFEAWPVRITCGGAVLASLSLARMSLLYVAGSSVTITTTDMELAAAIEYILSPASRMTGSNIGRDIATMMVLSIAFLPIIYEEYQSIRTAHECRGISFKGPVNAIKGTYYIAVPLLYSLSERADKISMAMESRCYGIKKKG